MSGLSTQMFSAGIMQISMKFDHIFNQFTRFTATKNQSYIFFLQKRVTICTKWVFPKIGVGPKIPKMDGENNGKSENPIKKWMIWGVFPLILETPKSRHWGWYWPCGKNLCFRTSSPERKRALFVQQPRHGNGRWPSYSFPWFQQKVIIHPERSLSNFPTTKRNSSNAAGHLCSHALALHLRLSFWGYLWFMCTLL